MYLLLYLLSYLALTAVGQRNDILLEVEVDNQSSREVEIDFVAGPQACDNPLPNANVPAGFCASIFSSGLSSPRGIVAASNGDLLVVESGKAQVTVLWTANGSVQKATLASASGLNHGIAINNGYLYASSATTLYRWKYTAGQRSNLGTAEVVIHSIPCCHHVTRTPVFDNQGLLYLSVGSQDNVAKDSTHARVVRFSLPSQIPSGGIDWSTGFLFANGLRNEVGLAFDSSFRLYGVENGVDDLYRADLGGDIHNNNPSEEVNLLDRPGRFYGYPYCWSEYDLPAPYGRGRGTQWAQPEFMNDGTHTDAWCRNTSNVIPPVYNMPAHTAPLGILFYYGKSFPASYVGGAFVALHGSWDRNPPQGYRVIHLRFQNGIPVSDSVLLSNNGPSQNWPNGVRPVSLAVAPCGTSDCLYVTSDSSGQIIQISYST